MVKLSLPREEFIIEGLKEIPKAKKRSERIKAEVLLERTHYYYSKYKKYQNPKTKGFAIFTGISSTSLGIYLTLDAISTQSWTTWEFTTMVLSLMPIAVYSTLVSMDYLSNNMDYQKVYMGYIELLKERYNLNVEEK